MDVDFKASENELYDRQVRVWGIQVQKQLSKGRILLIGDNCLAAEVAKNVVLAGVGNVSLMTSSYHFIGDEGSNFLSNCHPEMNTTEATAKVLREMNPLVAVSCLFLSKLDAHTANQFDVVCLAGGSLSDQVEVNEICRETGVKFCCGRSVSTFGWMFLDLLSHSYMADIQGESESRSMEFVSLRQALTAKQENLPRKLHGLYDVLRVCYEFEIRQNRPAINSDLESIKLGADQRMLSIYLETIEEFPPVCSVIGGMLANELVKIVSGKGDPVQNFLFYDLFDGKGVLHLIE